MTNRRAQIFETLATAFVSLTAFVVGGVLLAEAFHELVTAAHPDLGFLETRGGIGALLWLCTSTIDRLDKKANRSRAAVNAKQDQEGAAR